MKSRPRRGLRRAVLGGLGLCAVLGPAAFSGCATNFTPEGKIDTLRVLSVTVDKSYVPPIDPEACAKDATKCTEQVHFDMEVYDPYGVATQGQERRLSILWIGGCFNPQADQYSLCLFPLLELYKQGAPALDDAAKANG